MKWVCICLKTLYESHIHEGEDEAFTEFGFSIRMEESPEEGNPYYDLFDVNGGRRLCCDGEQCMVVRMEPGRITLVSDSASEDEEISGKEFQFVLSEAEFRACT